MTRRLAWSIVVLLSIGPLLAGCEGFFHTLGADGDADGDADSEADADTQSDADIQSDADADAVVVEGCSTRPEGCSFVAASAYVMARGGEHFACVRFLEEDGHTLWWRECPIDEEAGFDADACLAGRWTRDDIGDMRSLGGEVYHSEAIAAFPDPADPVVLHMIGDDIERPRFFRFCQATHQCGVLAECTAWERGVAAHGFEGALASFYVDETAAAPSYRFLEMGFVAEDDEGITERFARTSPVVGSDPWNERVLWTSLSAPAVEGGNAVFQGAGGFVYSRLDGSTGEPAQRSVQVILDGGGSSSWWRECPLDDTYFHDGDCAQWIHRDLSDLI